MDAFRRNSRTRGRRNRRRFALALILGLTLTVVAASVSFADTSGSGTPPPLGSPPPPDLPQTTDNGSTAGYPNATKQHAENLFANYFSQTVGSLAEDPVDLSRKNPTYLNDHTAVISPAVTGSADPTQQIEAILKRDQGDVQATTDDMNALQIAASGTPDNPPLLVSSMTPLRASDESGHKAPIDLSLDQQGSSYVPQNPLVDLSLPDSLPSDVAFGDQGIKIDAGATNSATADPVDGGQNLFYAGAATATDIVLAPMSGGLETLYQLRAPESPDHFDMSFSLPDGATLEPSDGGGAKIVQGGQTLAMVLPPSATDASGVSVPLTSTISADALTISIPHSDPNISYPIQIDPVTESYSWAGSTTGLGEWSTYSEDAGYQFTTWGGWYGLFTIARQGYTFGNYHLGGWYQYVPHYLASPASSTAYIPSATIGPAIYSAPTASTWTNQPILLTGLYDPASGWPAYAYWQNPGAGYYSNLNFSFNPPASARARGAAFYFQAPGTPHTSDGRAIGLAGATINLSDTDDPNFTSHDVTGGIQITKKDGNWGISNWVDSAPATLNTSATDRGLGISKFSLPSSTSGQYATRTESNNCDGTTAKQCPLNPAETTSFNTASWPNGYNATGDWAFDATGRFDWRLWEIRVDHSPPQISTSGSLTDQLAGPPYDLHVAATDGNASDSTQWQSGVKSIGLDVNGTHVASTGDQSCTAEAGSCPLSLNYGLQPSDITGSSVHLKVTATDEIGHTTTREWDEAVDPNVPTLQLSGPLTTATGTLTGVNYDLGIDVTGGLKPSPGPVSIAISGDGKEQDDPQTILCPGYPDPCALSYTWTLYPADYTGGSHTITVVATGPTGRTTQQTLNVSVPSPASSETTVVLSNPIPLNQLTPILSSMNATVLEYQDYTQGVFGGYDPQTGASIQAGADAYVAESSHLAAQLAAAAATPEDSLTTIPNVADAQPVQPMVTGFTLAGAAGGSGADAINTSAITSNLATDSITTQSVVPADGATTQTDPTAALSEDQQLADDTAKGGPPKWAPDHGRSLTGNDPNRASRREIFEAVRWANREDIDNLGGGHAYEHDVKEYNPHNSSGPLDHYPNCGAQQHRFWSDRPLDVGDRAWLTTYPKAAKPYFDTNFLDPCTQQDLTIGLYHPGELSPDHTYLTVAEFHKGKHDHSPMTLVAQQLNRYCDSGPNCVGTDEQGNGKLLIGQNKGQFPECRAWNKREPSHPCPNS